MPPTSLSPATLRASSDRPVLLCLLLSGASALIYEVAWVRSLELVFGSTTFAAATVLASFMGGLALGAWWMGSRSERFARFHPLRVYAVLELLLGGVALLIPALLALQAIVVRSLPAAIGESFVALSVVRLLLCAALLLAPTALMGATLPAVARLVPAGEAAGRRVGVLYAVNTLGAVGGCAAAGFVLLPRLGLARTQAVAVALNLAAAALALALARRRGHEAGAPAPALAAVPAAPARPAAARLLIVAYAASGATAMAYEVAWSRLLVLVLGSSTYAYTLMLATFLLGLALGAWAGARLLRPARTPLLAAAICQALVAVCTWLSLFLVPELPYWYLVAHDALEPGPRGLLGVQGLLAAALMILPTLGLGAMFPVTIGGLDPAGTGAPRAIGRAYAWNTIGAIAGSIAAGFWLVPGIGTRDTLRLGILVNTLVAVAAVFAARGEAPPRRRHALAAVLLLFAANLMVAAPEWRPEILSSGMFRYVDQYRGLDRAGFRRKVRERKGEILMFEEGLTCTVTVFRTTSSLSLLVNGKPDASVPPGLVDPYARAASQAFGDLPTQVLVAHLPILLAPAAERVMVIGLGSGVTLGSVVTHPVKRVECVELEEAVVRASRHFDDRSGAPLADPRVRLVVNDARSRLALDGEPYDVIISEPSNPWIAGAAALFTRDFFAVARGRLRPGGVFGQWVQLYELQSEDFLVLLRSFVAVFPEALLFRVGDDAILVGSDRALRIDLQTILTRATPRVRADLARIGVHGPEDLLARFWSGGAALRAAIPPGPLNTDDNMLIEFVAPLRLLAARGRTAPPDPSRDPARLFPGAADGLAAHLRFPDDDPVRQADFWARLATAALARDGADDALAFAGRSLRTARNPAACLVRGEALRAAGRADEALAFWAAATREFPADGGLRRALAGLHAERGAWAEARAAAEALLRLQPADPRGRRLLGEALHRLGEHRAAVAILGPLAAEGADDGGPAPGDLDLLLGAASLRAGLPAAAVAPLRARLARQPGDRAARALLVEALAAAGRPEEAAVAGRALQADAAPRAAAALLAGRAAWDAGAIAEARAHLEEAWQYQPEDDAIAFALARARARLDDRRGAIALLETFLAARPDHPWAVGYLAQLRAGAGEDEAARLMATRYRAMTGRDWEPIDRDVTETAARSVPGRDGL